MMRGRHLDICVLGAFQVAANGDLANGHSGEADAIPAVGGAMDLARGARATCVRRVHTDLAVLELRPAGVFVLEMAKGVDREALQACIETRLGW